MQGTSSELTTTTVDTDNLTESERHQLLSAQPRRTTLAVLATHPTPLDLEKLALTVAMRDNDPADVDDGTVDRMKVTLYHNHLPRMDDLGVVDFDVERKQVELTDVVSVPRSL